MKDSKLNMYGGAIGGSFPLLIFIVGMIVLTFSGNGGMTSFWAIGWLAFFLGIFLAKNKSDYCAALIRGVANSNGAVVITLYLFAGVFGQILTAGGLIEGLLWVGLEVNVQQNYFALLALLCTMFFSLATGSSVSTAAALTPVLYPAGILLGADPVMLAVGILAGAGFGDNVSPHSDTTIASAATQNASIREVVLARMPMVIIAALVSMLIIFLTGGGGEVVSAQQMGVDVDPSGLLMFISVLVLITAVFLNRHMIEAFVWGIVSAALLGILNGSIVLSDFFHIPKESGVSSGLIEDGILSISNTMIFVLIILAITQIMVESGAIDRILDFVTKKVAKGVRSAELSIIFVTTLISTPISHNTVAALLVGPGFVRKIGDRFNLSPSRKAILMDCSVTTLYFTIPWHSTIITWYGQLSLAANKWGIPLPNILIRTPGLFLSSLLLLPLQAGNELMLLKRMMKAQRYEYVLNRVAFSRAVFI
ncbi:Na+/H+ antiporter NhaC family protein [Shouchella clausii]|uniref:Na+/H+ antiporter NhaC family protein n=1 Tax=Shouchella clausii TaxID=79880 RepID=UPI003184127A